MPVQIQKQEHSPTLNTVIMVEDALKKMDDSATTIARLKKMLPRQVNHNTLIKILDYLQDSGKIFIGTKGITWTYNPNLNLQREIREAKIRF